MVKALVPGTFDPITAGHLGVIERAAGLFDEVVVGVAGSESKRGGPLFTIEERVAFVEEATRGMEGVSVKPFGNLLVDFARTIDAQVVVKGLRAVTDFEWEFQQAALNYHLDSELETVFIMSPPEYMYLSSSVVREIAQFGGDISGLVPDNVGEELARRFGCTFHVS
jgi:pantetheine-phosphate adenylyltransferase